MAQNSNEFRPTHPKGDFFDLKGQNTKVSREITAGITTFFAMAYIIIVNPNMLQQTGMPLHIRALLKVRRSSR